MTTTTTFTTYQPILYNLKTNITLIKPKKHIIPVKNLTHFSDTIRDFSKL